MSNDTSRRAFLESVGIGASVLAGGYAATSRGYAANETIGVGVIGCGGRAMRRLMPALKAMPGVKFVGVCDTYDNHIDAAKFIAAGKDKDIFGTRHHEELLARKDVDAVVIATPDHWHVPITIDACNAGKDVYVEKPLTHKLEEGAAVIKAEQDNKRIVQVGMQQRSMPHLMRAREIIREGGIGPVHKIRMSWNRNFLPFRKHNYNIKPEQVDFKRFLGNAPDQPFDPYRMRNWRWFWDFGGGILTDLMVHWFDAVNWMLDLGQPEFATTIADKIAADAWETPDTIQTLLHYPSKGIQCHFEGTFVNSSRRAAVEICGENATLFFDRGGFIITPEPHRGAKAEQMILGTDKERGLDFYDKPDGEQVHLGNWLECIRTRKTPSAPAEAGVSSAAAALMGNQAFREGRVVAATEKVGAEAVATIYKVVRDMKQGEMLNATDVEKVHVPKSYADEELQQIVRGEQELAGYVGQRVRVAVTKNEFVRRDMFADR